MCCKHGAIFAVYSNAAKSCAGLASHATAVSTAALSAAASHQRASERNAAAPLVIVGAQKHQQSKYLIARTVVLHGLNAKFANTRNAFLGARIVDANEFSIG